MKIIPKYALAWFPLVLLAILNGTIRQYGYLPYVGELTAHQLSTVSFIVLFGFYVWMIERKWPIPTSREAWMIGLMWVAMTLVFEFGFGHYVAGHPWSKLLHDYNLMEGRVWVLIVIATGVGPEVIRRLQRKPAGIDS